MAKEEPLPVTLKLSIAHVSLVEPAEVKSVILTFKLVVWGKSVIVTVLYPLVVLPVADVEGVN